MEFDLLRCEDGIKTDDLIFCIDCGTTYIKTLLLDKTGTAYHNYSYQNFPFDRITRMVDFNKCKIITTGAKSDALGLDHGEFEIVYYGEFDCISKLPACLGIDRAVVANIGTGTPFIAFENGEGSHLGGTGVGGGTIVGLAERLLGVTDPVMLEKMALRGNLPNINIMIGDIYKANALNELKGNYTASNFAKPASGAAAGAENGAVAGAAAVTGAVADAVTSAATDAENAAAAAIKSADDAANDLAMGIHSLVGEVVGSMAGQLAKYNGFDSVIFCGAVCDNGVIRRILSDCMELYGTKPIFIERPGFGTCFGAIMRYISESAN